MAGGINSGYQVVVSVVAGQGQEYINTLQSSLNKLAKGVSITPEYNDENIRRLKADLESIAKTQTIRLKLDDEVAIKSANKISSLLKKTFSDSFSAINGADLGANFSKIEIAAKGINQALSSTFDTARMLGATLTGEVDKGIGSLNTKLGKLKGLAESIGNLEPNNEMFSGAAENISTFVTNISAEMKKNPININIKVPRDIAKAIVNQIQTKLNYKSNAITVHAKLSSTDLDKQIKSLWSNNKKTTINLDVTSAQKKLDALIKKLAKLIKLGKSPIAIGIQNPIDLADIIKTLISIDTIIKNINISLTKLTQTTSGVRQAGTVTTKSALAGVTSILNAQKELNSASKVAQSGITDAKNFITNGVASSTDIEPIRNYLNTLEKALPIIERIKAALNSTIAGSDQHQQLLEEKKLWEATVREAATGIKKISSTQISADKSTAMLSNTLANMQKYWNQYGNQIKRNSNLLEQYIVLQKRVQGGSISAIAAQREFALFKNEAIASGIEAETLTNKMLRSFGTKARSQIAYGGWMLLTTTFRQLYQNILDVDTGMTELKKVTNATREEYANFLTEASARAERLGASLKEVVNISASYARLGYSLQEASNLANTAIVYHNVGDDVNDVDTATEHLISTMQAYNIEADKSMTIADKYNKVSNEFAVSAGDIGTGMQESSAAMEAANNTLEESIALFTAGNTVLQDSSKMGNVLKTTSMRIRGKDCAHYKETYRLPTLNKMAA